MSQTIEITTVNPGGPVYTFPADTFEHYETLETLVRDVYDKPSSHFDLHIHWRRACTDKLSPFTFDAIFRLNRVVPMAAEKRIYYVCFNPKAIMSPSPVDQFDNTSPLPGIVNEPTENEHGQVRGGLEVPNQRSEVTGVQTAHQNNQRLENAAEQCDIQRTTRAATAAIRHVPAAPPTEVQSGLPESSNLKRSSGEEIQTEEQHKRPRTTVTGEPAGSATVDAGASGVEPVLPTFPIASSTRKTPENDQNSLPGSIHRQSHISSRSPSVASSGIPPRADQPLIQPTDTDKEFYDFLLSKTVGNWEFVVGTLNRGEALKKSWDVDENGRLNAVIAQLESTGNRVQHYIMDYDENWLPLPKPYSRKICIKCVDYFTEIKPLQDAKKLKAFLSRYRNALEWEWPFERAVVEDPECSGENDTETEDSDFETEDSYDSDTNSDETGEASAQASKIIKLRVSQNILARLQEGFGDEFSVNTDTTTRSRKHPSAHQIGTPAVGDTIQTSPTRTLHTNGSNLDSSNKTPSAPPELPQMNESHQDQAIEEGRVTTANSHEVPRAHHQTATKTRIQQDKSSSAVIECTYLDITFTDHIDIKDLSAPLNFEIHRERVPVSWKLTQLAACLREHIDDKIINTHSSSLTDERREALEDADLVVLIKPESGTSTTSSWHGGELWFTCDGNGSDSGIDTVQNGSIGDRLTGYRNRTMQLEVQMVRKGRSAVKEARGAEKRCLDTVVVRRSDV